MKKCITLFSLVSLLFTIASAQFLEGEAAHQAVPGTRQVWIKSDRLTPAFMRFAPGQHIDRHRFEAYFMEAFKLGGSGFGFKKLKRESDQLGHVHERLQQTWQGIPVEGSMLILHMLDEKIYSLNGDLFGISGLAASPALSETEGLTAALAYVNAEEYMWQPIAAFGVERLRETSAHEGDLYPEGELVIVPEEADYKAGKFRLAWKFDIYSRKPMERTYTFVDAQDGRIILQLDRIHTGDKPVLQLPNTAALSPLWPTA